MSPCSLALVNGFRCLQIWSVIMFVVTVGIYITLCSNFAVVDGIATVQK